MTNNAVSKGKGKVDLERQTEYIPHSRTLLFLGRSGKFSQVRGSNETAFRYAAISLAFYICKEKMRTYFNFSL